MVTPFRINASDQQLSDLRSRLRGARWPEPATTPGWEQGVPLPFLQQLCAYWADGYDWRAREARLNAYPQFIVPVDGLDVHLLHLRSPVADALPLVLTHGWPGSVIEFLGVADRLRDTYHLVIPSLPGYGFSERPAGPGWTVERIADAWATLMTTLGYPRFGAIGSDWGTSVTTALGQRHPARLAGIHVVPPLAAPAPATFDDLTPAEQRALADLAAGDDGDGYSHVQSTRPQTIGYGLVDSPVALAAWIVEKFWAWSDHDGDLYSVISRDDLLDNLMLYWLPGTGASAARLYRESFAAVRERFTTGTPDTVSVPTGCSIFPRENPRPSRRWAARRFTDIRHWGTPPRGGHFAALEQPDLFAAEVRSMFDRAR